MRVASRFVINWEAAMARTNHQEEEEKKKNDNNALELLRCPSCDRPICEVDPQDVCSGCAKSKCRELSYCGKSHA